MPIKGLTDTGMRRFNEIGVIRKGPTLADDPDLIEPAHAGVGKSFDRHL